MISVEAARARILAAISPVAGEVVPITGAWHRVLAAPVTARLTQPPADVSAMDGYAVRASDAQAGATLRLIGEAPAGHPFDPNLHQAMAEQETDSHPPGTVLQVWSKAWTLNGRLLRPAMVVVAKAPAAELAAPGRG